MTLQDEVRRKEEEKKKLLALYSMLLLEDLLGEEDLYEMGSYQLIITWGDVISILENEDIPVDMVALEPVIERALSDYRTQVSELRDDPEGVQERINLTIWYVTWKTYGDATLNSARASEAEYIKWTTMGDSSVCEICLSLEGVYSLKEPLPELPAHPACRCWWEVPTVPVDSLDAARDALNSVHERYMAKIGVS